MKKLAIGFAALLAVGGTVAAVANKTESDETLTMSSPGPVTARAIIDAGLDPRHLIRCELRDAEFAQAVCFFIGGKELHFNHDESGQVKNEFKLRQVSHTEPTETSSARQVLKTRRRAVAFDVDPAQQ